MSAASFADNLYGADMRSEMQAMADVIAARTPLFPQASYRPEYPVAVPAMSEYIAALRTHDWTYQRADDYRSYVQGKAERERLVTLQQRLDPDRAIWRQHSMEAA